MALLRSAYNNNNNNNCTYVFSASDGLMYDIGKNKIKIQQII